MAENKLTPKQNLVNISILPFPTKKYLKTTYKSLSEKRKVAAGRISHFFPVKLEVITPSPKPFKIPLIPKPPRRLSRRPPKPRTLSNLPTRPRTPLKSRPTAARICPNGSAFQKR